METAEVWSRTWSVGFAKDFVFLVEAADLDEFYYLLKMNVFIVKRCLDEHSMEFAEAKTETVVL